MAVELVEGVAFVGEDVGVVGVVVEVGVEGFDGF